MEILFTRAILDVPALSIYSFGKYLLNTYHAPDTELDTKHSSANKTDMLGAVRRNGSRETTDPEGSAEVLVAERGALCFAFSKCLQDGASSSEGFCSTFCDIVKELQSWKYNKAGS